MGQAESSSIRTPLIIGIVASFTLFGTTLLAALARDSGQHPHDRCSAPFLIGPQDFAQ